MLCFLPVGISKEICHITRCYHVFFVEPTVTLAVNSIVPASLRLNLLVWSLTSLTTVIIHNYSNDGFIYSKVVSKFIKIFFLLSVYMCSEMCRITRYWHVVEMGL